MKIHTYRQIIVSTIILFCCSWKLSEQEEDRVRDCIHQCGDISIPYPFGIGPSHCYKHPDFAVSCEPPSQNPFLKIAKFEILKVNPSNKHEGSILVKIPISTACSINDTDGTQILWKSRNLSHSYFTYSTYENVFASVGCDGHALLYNEESDIVAGCTSVCNSNPPAMITVNASKCYGYHCCQAQVRSSDIGQNYGIGVVTSTSIGNNTFRNCRSAFLISEQHIKDAVQLALAPRSARTTSVPVVLQWYHFNVPLYEKLLHYLWLLILALPVGIPLAICGCFGGCWWRKTKKKRKEKRLRAKYFKEKLDVQGSSSRDAAEKTKLFTSAELKSLTENFSKDRVLGQGGQGTVYKGMLKNGHVVAVKRSSRALDASQWKAFINEVILLSQIKHKHVVKILGCCLEDDIPHVVYEFISNGTLIEYIQNTSDELLLTWEMRLRIAYQVATAISYLHSEFSTPIYHRDIKSSNILLDVNFRAKLSDFGISRAVHTDQTHLTTCVQGTFGYLDPEYFYSGQYTEKSDVYSFGVVLVELLTGQKPIRSQIDETNDVEEEDSSLVTYFISSMNASTLFNILDPIVLESGTEEEIIELANIAKQCINPRRIERPTMKEVTMVLEKLKCRKSSSMPLTPNADQIGNWRIRSNSIITSTEEYIYERTVTYDDVDIIRNGNLTNVDEMRLLHTT